MQFIQTRNYTTKIEKIFLNNAIYLSINCNITTFLTFLCKSKAYKFLFLLYKQKRGDFDIPPLV